MSPLAFIDNLSYETVDFPTVVVPSWNESQIAKPVSKNNPRRNPVVSVVPEAKKVSEVSLSTSIHGALKAGELLVAADGNLSAGYQFAKRSLDVIGASLLLVALSPILMITWIALMITTKGNPFFVQTRVGAQGRTFGMIKFRTMVLNAESQQHLVQNQHNDGPIFKNNRDPRITSLGRILRATSIDEFPQLLHVLSGKMSLVGPRPPVPREVAKYEPWQLRRLSIKPGLTCLWQVSGRSTIGFIDWVKMDLWYIQNQTLATDLGLLFKTPWAVLSRRGAY